MELRRGSCETSLGVVIFQSKLVSVLLKVRVALALHQYYNRPEQPILQFFSLPQTEENITNQLQLK